MNSSNEFSRKNDKIIFLGLCCGQRQPQRVRGGGGDETQVLRHKKSPQMEYM